MIRPGPQVLHDSREPIITRKKEENYIRERTVGIYVEDSLYHGVEWEEPCIGTICFGSPIDERAPVEEIDAQIRIKLLDVSEKCRVLAEELLEHALRLEARATDEVILEQVK